MQDHSIPVQMLLTSPQLRNLNNGKAFQMSHHQLINGTGNKHVELHLSPDEHHRLMKNIQYGKGHRFKMNEIRGGSFLGSLSKAAKSITKVIPKSVAQTGVDIALNSTPLGGTPIGNELGQTIVNKAYGNGLFGDIGHAIKKAIPKNIAKDVINTGLSTIGANNPITQSLVNTGVNSAYGHGLFSNIGNAIKKAVPKSVAKDIVKTGLQTVGLNNPIAQSLVNAGVNSAYSGGKLKKGSLEMKARMAHLRSMRKGKGIGSFVKGIASNVKKSGIRNGLADSLIDGINSVSGTKLGNTLQPLIHQGINKGLDKVNVGVGINPCSQLTDEVRTKVYKTGRRRGNGIIGTIGGTSGFNHGNGLHGGSFASF